VTGTMLMSFSSVIGRLLPDGSRLPEGGQYLRALGGMAIVPRDLRGNTQPLFPGGPVRPGADPVFAAPAVPVCAASADGIPDR
jgi:hypothetical protein